MKFTIIIITIVCLHVSAATYAQKITLVAQDLSLSKVLQSIKKQSGYALFYDNTLVRQAGNTTIDIKNVSVDEALTEVLKDKPFTFAIIDQTIVIKSKDASLLNKIKSMSTTITGKITDEKGKPLPGVSVLNEKTKQATVTNMDGDYNIPGDKGDILVFSFIGYKTKETNIAGERVINLAMEQSLSSLDQVVVIGYGSTKKKDLTGAVSIINTKDVEDVPFTTIDNALAGKAAGVQVTKSDGTPGGAVQIRIRGSSSFLGGNDPLYIIDGVPLQVQNNFKSPGYGVGSPVGNDITGSGGISAGLSTSFVNGLNSLGGLNVDDIESITILKDASSSAIYGSKAANGVVIITTKRGKKDMKPQITASYYTTVSSPITPHLLNAGQYRTLLTEAAQNDYNALIALGYPVYDNDNAILNSPSTYFGTGNTNWVKAVTRNTVSENAELSVQGGGSSSKYFSSVSYNNTPGVVDVTGYQRVSGKINLENEIGPKFRFITNLILGYTNQGIGDGAYGQAIRARPDYTPYDALGNYTDFSPQGYSSQGFLNPVALLTATNNAKTFTLLGSVSGIYDITKDLQFKSTGSLNMNIYNQRTYIPSYLDIGSNYGNVVNNGGIGSNLNSNTSNWFAENTLTYTKTLGKNNTIDVVAGTSYETDKTSFFSATATNYPNDNVLNSLSSAGTPLLVTGDDPSHPQNYLLSFYVRANYGFMDKYLFTFTGRSDASSKFGPNNKTGYFPSGALAWRLSKEDFLKDVKWIDDIKVRGSYGLTGTQNIGNQMYRTLYSPYTYAGSSALIPTQLGNQNIKWESTREADGGFDFSLFNGRLQGTADYYNKQTNGALLNLPIAPSSSYSSLLSNSANIKNTGVEISLTGDLIRTKDFKWNASINITWNNSIVTKLDANANLGQIGDLTGLEYNNTTLVQGQPLGLITGMKVTGIIKTQAQLDAYKKALSPFWADDVQPTLAIGDPMFELDPVTKQPSFNTVIAHAQPKYYGGFTQGFTYKNFDLQFYFTFSEGGQLLWGDHIASEEFSGTANANVTILNRYTPTNTNTNEPRLVLNDALLNQSNLDVFSSSYIKLRTLTFNYHLTKARWMEKAGMHSATLFASATNLFTITKYPGNDPETSDDPYSVAGGYFDVSNYPTVHTFSIGLKAGF